MLAETHGKLDPATTQPGDRMEDTLTDAVFSAIKYLPRNLVLGPLLRRWLGVDLPAEAVESARFEFWPRLRHGTEPDVRITAGGHVFIVEAKYGAPFSTGDGTAGDHQLVHQWDEARLSVAAQRLHGPWVIAVTSDPSPPSDIEFARTGIDRSALAASGIGPDRAIQWMRWQEIAHIITAALPEMAQSHRELATDVLALMDRRKVRTMFQGFDPGDYWQVVAARRTAEQRLYPAVAALTDELIGHLHDHGIEWATNDSGVISYYSLARSRASEWPLGWVILPFWPETFPTRPNKHRNAYLFVLFSMLAPEIRFGWFQAATSYGMAKNTWGPLADALATDFSALPEGYRVAIEYQDYAHLTNTVNAADAHPGWVEESLSSSKYLWVYRTMPIEDLTESETLANLLVEDRDLVGQMPAIWESLRAASYIE